MDIIVKPDPDGEISYADNSTEERYFKKYQALLRRCGTIQKENQMLINRTYRVKRLVGRLKKDRKFIMDELDRRNDNYRSQSLTISIEDGEKGLIIPQSNKRDKDQNVNKTQNRDHNIKSLISGSSKSSPSSNINKLLTSNSNNNSVESRDSSASTSSPSSEKKQGSQLLTQQCWNSSI